MAQIIAETYEIIREIGAGGGGIVYLAKHLRLDKFVVLKADRRTIATKPEALRREVDALKNLSHTYIPQVYDFVSEDGIVYTVMDYIEGESLDKPLKRGEHFSQAQVVEWLCELLEAVAYLHSRPPHGILHADIKPANIMLTPAGDIRLIDFNIALALGEEGAVRVGRSQGYASPEHYGLDYSTPSASSETVLAESETSADPSKTRLPENVRRTTDSSGRSVLLDVRSDIYSVGATAYHLLSGERPARDARDVVKLSSETVSPLLVQIVAKAMAPNPNDRYQTAEEMLDALKHLHENDPRTKKRKQSILYTGLILSAAFLLGVGSVFIGLRMQKEEQEAAKLAAEAAEETQRAARILAEQSEEQERQAKEKEQTEKRALQLVKDAQERIGGGDNNGAISLALEALGLSTRYDAQAQKALTDALGIYDLSDGFRPQQTVDLPASPFKAALSPDGGSMAAFYPWETAVYDTASGSLLFRTESVRSATADVLLVSDRLLICAAEDGIEAVDLRDGTTRWRGEKAARMALSGDGKRIAAVYREDGYASIYDTETGTLVSKVSFHGRKQAVDVDEIYIDRRDSLLCLNYDGTALAVSFSDGTLAIYNAESGSMEEDLLSPSGFTHFEGGFYADYFVFCASGEKEAPLFALVNLKDSAKDVSMYLPARFLLQVDHRGIYIASGNTLVRLDPETGEQTGVAYVPDQDIAAFCCDGAFAAVADGKRVVFFDRGGNRISEIQDEEPFDFLALGGAAALAAGRNSPSVRLLSQNDRSGAEVFAYDPAYTHREARISSDRSTVMLFSRGGFRLYSIGGGLIAEQGIPDENRVYDQQYRRDDEGSRLEVIYRDGTVRSYSAKDGALLSTRQDDPPSADLEEDFETDAYRIHTIPHEAPKVFDKATGQHIRDLESDDDLTYVTQIGDFILTEYISTQGERYGLLLNGDCETLARLPYLCDAIDGELVFDFPSGHLRRSPIYSAEELIAAGNARIS